MALEPGKLYIMTDNTKYGEPQSLVLLVSVEKVKPIYTKFNVLLLAENRADKLIIDKFGLEKFEKRFVEVTDEKQIEEARKRVKT